MKQVVCKISGTIHDFIADNSAVAAVEFALIMPLMLTLYIGSAEASRAIAYDRRLTSAASALGDLVAQTKDSITTIELNEFFRAAELSLAPYDAATVSQVVTCVQVDSDGDAKVIWSHGHNGGNEHANNAAFDLPDEFVNIAVADSYVIVAEAKMVYQPITSFIFKGGMNLSQEFYFAPRFGGLITVDPS